jgi:hypothetical protein
LHPSGSVRYSGGSASHFIVNPLTGRQVSFQSLFRTRPGTEERVVRLRAIPVTV